MSGIQAEAAAIEKFLNMQKNKTRKLFVCKISDNLESIEEDKSMNDEWDKIEGKDQPTTELFVEFLKTHLPNDECRYIFLDVEIKKEGLTTNNKVIDISW